MIVLDASALLAHIKGETGAEALHGRINGSAISAVNLAEVLSKCLELGRDPDLIRSQIANQGINVFEATDLHAARVASLEPMARRFDLSYADRFAVALAEELSAELLTADTVLASLSCGARITKFR